MIEFNYDYSEVLIRLRQLNSKLKDMSEPMKDIGEYLTFDTRRRFDEGRGPDGTPWAPRQVSSIAAHLALQKGLFNKNGTVSKVGARKLASMKTLVRNGYLRDSIAPESGSDYVRIGANRPYAAIHQFGGKTKAHVILPKNKKALAWPGGIAKRVNHPGSQIPARPYMGASEENKSHILAIINGYLGDFE